MHAAQEGRQDADIDVQRQSQYAAARPEQPTCHAQAIHAAQEGEQVGQGLHDLLHCEGQVARHELGGQGRGAQLVVQHAGQAEQQEAQEGRLQGPAACTKALS